MIFESKKFDELSAEELYEIMKSRNDIFVVEQNCIYQDCDDCDYGYHVFARDDYGRVAAYMRIYEIEEEPKVIMLNGRAIWSGNLTDEEIRAGEVMDDYARELADYSENSLTSVSNCDSRQRTVQMGRVLTLHHGKGLGKKLLEEGIITAWEKMHADRIFIEAEDYVEGYYLKAGFIRTSDVFMKDDIPHIHMELYRG